ncbi:MULTISPECIES: ExbD/TolR family protein [Pseudoalteromonas]|uniref:Biopolymer transporter ExbD n=1 Tax=Pseudoalteromonas fuliginea TaxID=1872678 RepID=A0A063KI71_9GAMM|nr:MULTISPECIES: biopolymer transporter ExbD [Pseudoalteromonas]ALQ09268.1 biopolymer transporter ExbD [Pseudoalteromonas sp. Bsw20308]ATG76542.1 biopolymer transporter ExbD [Pseudoalteromonas sp. 1_2015MBL_MicDiv]KAA1152255.1 biopolymer transporter ExbD [Pseudoalteromonas fuliginea]KAA1159709.1 biopolymer transporter ExbD [Pseudoalteromonas fuliginea]KAA1166352.1 biopolymer transporter ExbD [Pseudoalteromonas fuliginea]
MQSRLKHRLEQESGQHIDMSPLLDVVFILLIFFIVTTVFVRESGVEVDKPQAVSASRLEQQVIFLAITDTQQVFFDGSQIGVAGVRSSVEQMLKQQQRPVVIQADKTVPTELLVQVIDEAKLAGAAQVNLATKQ